MYYVVMVETAQGASVPCFHGSKDPTISWLKGPFLDSVESQGNYHKGRAALRTFANH